MTLLQAQGDLRWTQAFIGIPYADKGRGIDACDCWGLVRLVYADQLRIDLPSYDELYPSSVERAEIAAIVAREAKSQIWRMAEDAPRAFDILWFRRGRHDAHCGIYLKRGLMLHMAEDDCGKIERFDVAPWASRLTGIYRWRGQP